VLATAPPVSYAENSSKIQDLRSEIKIPEKLAGVEKAYVGTSAFPIIYIQDAHNSFEAQENIAGLINSLVGQYGVQKVLVEGYEGEYPFDSLFDFDDPELKEKVSRFFMDYLRLTGAQYAYINREQDYQLIGIENINDYLGDIKAYEEGAKNREWISEDLGKISKYLNALAGKLYPKEIRSWKKLKKRFEEDKLSLADYLFRAMKIYHEAPSAERRVNTRYLAW